MRSKTVLGENIYRLRKKKRWNQGELAERLGITRAAISQFELGDTTPSLANQAKLSEVLEDDINNPTTLVSTDYEEPEWALTLPSAHLGANILAGRMFYKWTQQNLGEKLGNLSVEQVDQFEQGVRPNASLLWRLESLFGIAMLTQSRHFWESPHLVVVARTEEEFNARIEELVIANYQLRGPLHVTTDALGLLLVQDLFRA